MKIVQIINQHKRARGRMVGDHYVAPQRIKAGNVRVEAILASGKRGHHTRHLDVPKGFDPSTPHIVDSIENVGAQKGERRFSLVVKKL